MDLICAEYGWTLDEVLDRTLAQLKLARRSIFARRRADHERQVLLTEQAVKVLVANVHAAAGSKYGQANAQQISFLQEKKTRVASHERIVGAFGGEKPLFSAEQMEAMKRGRRSQRGNGDLPGNS